MLEIIDGVAATALQRVSWATSPTSSRYRWVDPATYRDRAMARYAHYLEVARNASWASAWPEDVLLNAGGSPTYQLYNQGDYPFNELAAGSCLVKPTDFDPSYPGRSPPRGLHSRPGAQAAGRPPAARAWTWESCSPSGTPTARARFFTYGGYWKADPASPPGLSLQRPCSGDPPTRKWSTAHARVELGSPATGYSCAPPRASSCSCSSAISRSMTRAVKSSHDGPCSEQHSIETDIYRSAFGYHRRHSRPGDPRHPVCQHPELERLPVYRASARLKALPLYHLDGLVSGNLHYWFVDGKFYAIFSICSSASGFGLQYLKYQHDDRSPFRSQVSPAAGVSAAVR